MPRTGAQDEAHRLENDFELSLGAHGGAVCSASLNRQRRFCCCIELSIQRRNLHSSDAPTGVRHPHPPSNHTTRRHHTRRRRGVGGVWVPVGGLGLGGEGRGREGGAGGGKEGLPLGLWSSQQIGMKVDSFSSSLVSSNDRYIQNSFIQ